MGFGALDSCGHQCFQNLSQQIVGKPLIYINLSLRLAVSMKLQKSLTQGCLQLSRLTSDGHLAAVGWVDVTFFLPDLTNHFSNKYYNLPDSKISTPEHHQIYCFLYEHLFFFLAINLFKGFPLLPR